MSNGHGRLSLCVLALLLLAVVVRPQSTPTIRPPDQTYILGFNGFAIADGPNEPTLSLGATFSVEFWMMLDPNAPDRPMGVFGKGLPNDGDPFAKSKSPPRSRSIPRT